METSQYNIGDWVRITEPGWTYSTYSSMFQKLGFRDTERNGPLGEDTLARVFAYTEHDSNSRMLYALRDTHGIESLIDDRGITEPEMYVKTWDGNCWFDLNNAMMYVTLDVAEPIVVDVLRIRNPETGTYADFIPTGTFHEFWHNSDHDITLCSTGIEWRNHRLSEC